MNGEIKVKKQKNELKWEIISTNYSDEARKFKNKYQEIVEEYGNEIIIGVYKLQYDMYAIFIDYYKNISGVIYVPKEDVYKIKEEIKIELENNYVKSDNGNKEFSKYFNEKYNVREIPEDFFDEDYENKENEFKTKEIRCVFNNKGMIFALSIISLCLVIYNFLEGASINFIIIVLIILLYIVFLLRIRNFELLVKDTKITYKNLFGKKTEYYLDNVKKYKIFEFSYGYKDLYYYKILLLYLNEKRIWLFDLDSDFEELIDYLEYNKIKQISNRRG